MTPDQGAFGVLDGTDLARRIELGDRGAEADFVRRYCDCVFAVALSRTHDREAARELVDDVLMAVISALRQGAVRNRDRLAGFVHGTTMNIVSAYLRQRRRRPRTVSLECESLLADPNDEYAAQDRKLLVEEAMALLNDLDQRILQMGVVEGLKPGEIAARLRLSPALVRQRKCRALRAIVLFASDPPDARARRMLLRTNR